MSVDRLISDAARRATALWRAEMRLKKAMAEGGEKKVLEEAERLQEALR